MRRHLFAKLIVLCVVSGILLLATSCEGDESDGQTDGDTPGDGDSLSDGDTPSDGDLADLSYPIVDTNQSSCYDDLAAIACPQSGEAFFGQDAQYDGFTPRYTDNSDGTITDTITGLMWVKDAGEKVQYGEAIAAADDFSLAGYDDWRVPTIKELYSLILFSGMDIDPTATGANQPFIDDKTFVFEYGDTSAGERIIDSQWVTRNVYNDTVMGGEQCFFGVNFADGRIKCYPTMEREQGGYFVRYVRGGSGYGTNDFADNGDGTISDNATGLMWMQGDSGNGMNWQDALLYCETLQFAGYDDWKLPNAKQLQSLVDYSRSPGTTNSPAIDPLFECSAITNEAGQADYGWYWSGSTHANQQGGAEGVYVTFGGALGYMNDEWMDVHGAGAQRSDPKSGDASDYPEGFGPQGDAIRIDNFVRCVRDDSDFNANPDGDLPVDGDLPSDGDVPNDGDVPDGPIACSVQADCETETACPPDAAKGCVCSQTPEGSLCLPACDSDSDCPEPADQTLVCDSNNGICVPQNQ